ncbi:MAG: hypothetical protein IPM25_12505 [Chloracidobacterium sp.]|nr:hypothetical protein [Chloracidobacterium sp.]
MRREPLWTCTKCGRPFVKPNHPHSCGEYSVEAFLENKPPDAIELFQRFCDLVKACGPFTFAPAKTRIGFQVRMIFAAVNGLSSRGMRCHVVLTRRLESPRFDRIEKLGPRCYVNHFTIRTLDDLDEEVAEWLNESYKVGNQEHLS